jgi:Niemann-Pick C2 protein
MLALSFLVLLSCSVNLIWTATPYKDCGSELGTIQAFDVTGCTTAPCKFSKGTTYTMNLTIKASAPSKSASVRIYGRRREHAPKLRYFLSLRSGVIGGVPIPFPLPNPDACQLGMKCPISQNDVNLASLSLPVLASYPTLSLYVKIELKADDQNQDYACILFPASIVG